MNATVLDNITTVNQNTQQRITWNIVYSREAASKTRQTYGWTHQLGVIRPKGKRPHCMWVEMIGDVVVRSSTPVAM